MTNLYDKWRRKLRFFIQRRIRGWDDSETWSLDSSLARIILPRLKRFRELTIAHPSNHSEDEWNEILDKIIAAFEFAASEGRWQASPEEYDKHHEGIKLFAQYYWALWW